MKTIEDLNEYFNKKGHSVALSREGNIYYIDLLDSNNSLQGNVFVHILSESAIKYAYSYFNYKIEVLKLVDETGYDIFSKELLGGNEND